MSLKLLHTFDSPLEYLRQAMWVSAKRDSFFLTDIFKIAELKFNTTLSVEILAEARDKEEAYKLKKPYEDRFDSTLYQELCEAGVNGFEYLSQVEYDREEGLTAGSDTLFDLTNVYGVQGYELPVRTKGGTSLRFSKKEIQILDNSDSGLRVNYSLPFKSKDVSCIYGLQQSNRVVYGTTTGKVGMLNLADKKSKPKPFGDGKNVCVDITGTLDDKFVFACGMGYVNVYDITVEEPAVVANVQTSGRSIGVIGENIILNKGMHGLSLFSFSGGALQKTDELEVGFDMDKMCINKLKSTVLISSKPTGKLALVKIL